MTQPVPVGGGSFEVDITRAPEAIRELETALRELEDMKKEVAVLGRVSAPTTDLVSIDAAAVLSAKAVGGPNSFMEAITAGINEVTRMIEALRVGFAEYERADQDAVSALG